MVKLTKNDVLLFVAKKLPQPFPVNDLVVAAFKQEPTMFALDGYPKLVNNNKVLSALMGKTGLVHRGLLEKVQAGVYKLPIRSTMEVRDEGR